MKTKITVNQNRSVTVDRDDYFSGKRTESTYYVVPLEEEAFVYLLTNTGAILQVCAGMSALGRPIRASRESLPAVLRRELRKLNAAEKRTR